MFSNPDLVQTTHRVTAVAGHVEAGVIVGVEEEAEVMAVAEVEVLAEEVLEAVVEAAEDDSVTSLMRAFYIRP